MGTRGIPRAEPVFNPLPLTVFALLLWNKLECIQRTMKERPGSGWYSHTGVCGERCIARRTSPVPIRAGLALANSPLETTCQRARTECLQYRVYVGYERMYDFTIDAVYSPADSRGAGGGLGSIPTEAFNFQGSLWQAL